MRGTWLHINYYCRQVPLEQKKLHVHVILCSLEELMVTDRLLISNIRWQSFAEHCKVTVIFCKLHNTLE